MLCSWPASSVRATLARHQAIESGRWTADLQTVAVKRPADCWPESEQLDDDNREHQRKGETRGETLHVDSDDRSPLPVPALSILAVLPASAAVLARLAGRTPANPARQWRTAYASSMASGGFEVVCEIEPPTRPDLMHVRHQIGVLSKVASAFLIPDNHIGRATVSSIAVAHEVEQMGGRSIACLNARDRNLLGFRRDLLTAAAYGVDRFLFVYGDRPSSGAAHRATHCPVDDR